MSIALAVDHSLPQIKRISTRTAREQFSDLIGQVHYTGEPVLIERSGKPMVVLLSVESYEQLLVAQPVPEQIDKAAESITGMVDPLFGAFPELAAIPDEDLAWAKAQWDQSVEKQLHTMDGQAV
jgi:prevent-host-death family protein